MKRNVFAAIGALVSSAAAVGPAAAADLSTRYQQPLVKAPAYAPLYNWSGFYLGINGGGGWGRSTWDRADTFNLSGGMVGGTAGYNWQMGQVVLGLEGDIDWSGIGGTTTT